MLRCHGLRSAQRWPLCKSSIRRSHPPGSSLEQQNYISDARNSRKSSEVDIIFQIHCMPKPPVAKKLHLKNFMRSHPRRPFERKCVTTSYSEHYMHSKRKRLKPQSFEKVFQPQASIHKNKILQGNEEQRFTKQHQTNFTVIKCS